MTTGTNTDELGVGPVRGSAGRDPLVGRADPVVLNLRGNEPQLVLNDAPVGLTIPIAAAVGSGPTVLAAFDASLRLTGVANFNLVRLSSVIPPGSTIVPIARAARGRAPGRQDANHPALLPAGAWGDRLYVVYAAQTATEPREQAWAGIGWVQDSDDRRGLFVEHEGTSEAAVTADIVASLGAMTAGRSGDWSEPELVVTGGAVDEEPICALVVATYESSPWTGFAE